MLLTLFPLLLILTISYCLKSCSAPMSPLLRVIGGTEASARDYPWQTVFVSYDRAGFGMMCGGSVIDDRWIMTAAHCIIPNTVKAYVLVGLRSLSNPDHTHRVKRVVVHPKYNANAIHNDIALIETFSILLHSEVEPVCLTRDDEVLLSQMKEGIVTGFGLHLVHSVFEEGLVLTTSDVILETQVHIISASQCREEWKDLSMGSVQITTNQICAGSKYHGTAPGDSGGPLLVRDSFGRLIQVGITSFGASGVEGLIDQSTYPGVYTRVSPYFEWIEAETSSCREILVLSGLSIFIHFV